MKERFTGKLVAAIAIVTVLLLGLNAQAALNDGLIAYWPFDNDAVDYAGGNNGTLQGGASYVTGKIGQAVACSTSGTSDWVLLTSEGTKDGDWTTAAWVNMHNNDTGGLLAGTEMSIRLCQFQQTTRPGLTDIVNNINGAWDGSDSQTTIYDLPLDTWVLLVFVGRDTDVTPDGVTDEVELYADDVSYGKLVYAEVAGTNGDGNPATDPTIQYLLTWDRIGNLKQYPDYGSSIKDIDEVAIWDRCLSSGEITALYSGGTGISMLHDHFLGFTQSASSGIEDGNLVNFEVTLSPPIPSGTVTLNYAVTDIDTGSGDYTPYLDTGVLTFTNAVSSQNVQVTITNDIDVENDEQFLITLSGLVDGGHDVGLGVIQHTYTILASDIPPVFEFTTATSTGTEGCTITNIEVTATPLYIEGTTYVDYTVTDISTGSGDYTPYLDSGTLTFGPSVGSQFIDGITITDDIDPEGDEQFLITLSDPAGAPGASVGTMYQHTFTIKASDNTMRTTGLAEDMLGYWRMEESCGTTVTDSALGGNDGTIATAGTGSTPPEWQPQDGILGGCLKFDGLGLSDGHYVEIANESYFDVYDQISLSFWIKPEGTTTDIGFISKGNSAADGWNMHQVNALGSSCQVNFTAKENGGAIYDFTVSEPSFLQENVWAHIVLTFDSTADEAQMYVNSALRDISTAPALRTTDNTPLRFACNTAGDNSPQNFFNGCMDEVAIWGRVLTTDDIELLYNDGAGTVIGSENLGHGITTGDYFDADPANTTGLGTWIENTDHGIDEEVYTSAGGSPGADQLTTTVTGLEPGILYDVYVVFMTDPTPADWKIMAGLDPGSMSLYNRDNSAAINYPQGDEGYEAYLGIMTADTNGQIDVYVDDTTSTSTYYDGVAYHYSTNVPISHKPMKIFILSGQSNMQGHGYANEADYLRGTLEGFLADPIKRLEYEHLVDAGDNWLARDDVWVQYGDRTPVISEPLIVGLGAHYQISIGPELGFGWVVGDYLNEQVMLIKTCWGGKSLAVDFRPPSSGGTVGEFYTKMLSMVDDVINNISSHYPGYDGLGYEIAGFGWHQGWNDYVNTDYVNEYEANMVNLIRDVRAHFGTPDLPFVIGASGMTPPGWTSNSLAEQLIAAQAAPANPALYPEFDGTVGFAETRDFWRDGSVSPFDGFGFHWCGNFESYYLLGEEMGEVMLNYLSGGLQMHLEGNYYTSATTGGIPFGNPVFVTGNQARVDNGSVELDGDDSIELPGYKGVTGTKSRSATAWIKTPADGQIMSWGNAAAGENWIIEIQSGFLHVDVGSGSATGSVNIANNKWYHIAVVLEDDGSANADDIRFYINGVFDSGITFVLQDIDTIETGDVIIGTGFIGRMDEVAIYNVALSDNKIAEICAVYNLPGDLDLSKAIDAIDFAMFAAEWQNTACGDCNGADLTGDNNVTIADLRVIAAGWMEGAELPTPPPSPIAHWKLDETTGITAVDSSLSGYNGTLTNMAGTEWTTDPTRGNVLSLNGSDDYVEMIGYKGISGNASRTCTAWIKTGTVGTVIAWGDTASAGQRWHITIFNDVLYVRVKSGSAYGSTTLTDNQWHHVAVVLDGGTGATTGDIRLYVDGDLEAVTVATQNIVTPDVNNVRIGIAPWTSSYFNGLIDDVRIYDRALSEPEIADLAN